MKSMYGLLGKSLGHSISPIIHQSIFETHKISAYYHLFEVENGCLREAVEGLKALGAAGINVTIPYKTDVIRYLDKISPEASEIGAVNTIAFKAGAAEGFNTDYHGFGMLLKKYGIHIDGTEVLVLGYGGGAKAVIRFLLNNQVKRVTVAVRNARSRDLAIAAADRERLAFVDYRDLTILRGGDLIVNCTPTGMHPHVCDSPVSVDIIKKYETAVDLIYNPPETLFLRQAKEAGLRAVNGLYMLVGQAVTAQSIWNGIAMSYEETDRIFDMIVEYMHERVYSP